MNCPLDFIASQSTQRLLESNFLILMGGGGGGGRKMFSGREIFYTRNTILSFYGHIKYNRIYAVLEFNFFVEKFGPGFFPPENLRPPHKNLMVTHLQIKRGPHYYNLF